MAEAADCNLQQPLLAESEEEQRLKYFEFVQSLPSLFGGIELHTFLIGLIVIVSRAGVLLNRSATLDDGLKYSPCEVLVTNSFSPLFDTPYSIGKMLHMRLILQVDESVNRVQSRVPPTLKEVSTQAFETAQKAPAAARSVVTEVKNTGVVALPQDLQRQYMPSMSLQQGSLHQAVGPTASYCSEMYNQTVQQAAEKGYKVAAHLPLVPTERIARVLST
ncbi:Stress-related protein [Sesamum angolense]|uniref:Stress-related protein n=1 Tax=Sesamum angolense TaxID=2727404 RepID=A0AAE1T3M3_9LAMI|nr:Stress-related protein [Sesamum angolense]